MSGPHVVPLSTQALEVIRQLRELNGRWKWIFPNQSDTQKPISQNTVLFALYRMGYHLRMTGTGSATWRRRSSTKMVLRRTGSSVSLCTVSATTSGRPITTYGI